MKLKFTKMHGAGNDFVVIDAINQQVAFTPAQWQRLADRRFGVGADQMLVVEKAADAGHAISATASSTATAAKSSSAATARAPSSRFVTEKGLTAKRAIRVETMSGVIEPRMEDDGGITVDMGAPVLEPARVPFDASGLAGPAAGRRHAVAAATCNGAHGAGVGGLDGQSACGAGGRRCRRRAGAAGRPADRASSALSEAGQRRLHAGRRPPRISRLRVFERGAGETLACGTGACAAVVAGIRRGLLDSPVRVGTRGGELSIAWAGGKAPVC